MENENRVAPERVTYPVYLINQRSSGGWSNYYIIPPALIKVRGEKKMREEMSTYVKCFKDEIAEFMNGCNVNIMTCIFEDGELRLYGSHSGHEIEDCLIEVDEQEEILLDEVV